MSYDDYGDQCENCGEYSTELSPNVEQRDHTWLCWLCIERRLCAIWTTGPSSEAARAFRGEGSEPRMRRLVHNAVRSAGRGEDGHVSRWSAVGYMFGLGSTSATALCRELGFDPDEEMGNPDEEEDCDVY